MADEEDGADLIDDAEEEDEAHQLQREDDMEALFDNITEGVEEEINSDTESDEERKDIWERLRDFCIRRVEEYRGITA